MASSPGLPSGPVSPETYWRRRVFLLAGVLVVVALIAWSCSGQPEGGQQAASVNPDTSESPDSPDSDSSPSPSASATESPSGEPSTGGGEGGGSGSGDGDGSGSGGAEGAGSAGSGSGGEDHKAPEKPEDACLPKDIVVTFKADDKDYASDEEPKFKVILVNTEKQTCTVNVGPKALELVITSGDDRIFSTADCVEGDGTNKEQLERGVPYTKTIEWHRQRSWKECRDDDVDARSGTYVAELKTEYDEAEERVFRLN